MSDILDNQPLTRIMLNVESFLDNIHIHAYRGFTDSYLVQGPMVNKYWIEFSLEFPAEVIPDPSGIKLLEKVGCLVDLRKIKRMKPVDINSSADYEPGTRYPKKETVQHYVIDVMFPRDSINEMYDQSDDQRDEPAITFDEPESVDDELIQQSQEVF